jgi:NADP-dependent 3-hydroxy acid dehydrogenase YdfG
MVTIGEDKMSVLKGRAAIVTGSTSGIGRGIAHALAKEGVHIMTNGFGDKPETIEQVKKEISDYGVRSNTILPMSASQNKSTPWLMRRSRPSGRLIFL